jgi:hypothetical protein
MGGFKMKIIRHMTWVMILVAMMAGSVMAAGSCIQYGEIVDVPIQGNVQRKYITFDCTGDGTIAAYSFNPKTFGVWGWYLYNVTTNPGSSAPTAAYDITLVVDGETISGTLLNDRSATLTQTVAIAPTTIGYFMMDDVMTINFADQTANPSTIRMKLRFITN